MSEVGSWEDTEDQHFFLSSQNFLASLKKSKDSKAVEGEEKYAFLAQRLPFFSNQRSIEGFAMKKKTHNFVLNKRQRR